MVKNINRDYIVEIHKELFEKIVMLDVKLKKLEIEYNI